MQKLWTIKDKTFEQYISSEEIQERVLEIANRMNTELAGKNPIFIVVLNGAFIFASDLIKNITIDCEISFVKLASYHGMRSTGEVKEVMGLNMDIHKRVVVVIEDIIDTGLTLDRFIHTLYKHKPSEVKIAACFIKPQAFGNKFPVDYSCFDIPNDFVVGYGLDYDGLGRNSGSVYKLFEPAN